MLPALVFFTPTSSPGSALYTKMGREGEELEEVAVSEGRGRGECIKMKIRHWDTMVLHTEAD